jgi:hypothetical protein
LPKDTAPVLPLSGRFFVMIEIAGYNDIKSASSEGYAAFDLVTFHAPVEILYGVRGIDDLADFPNI